MVGCPYDHIVAKEALPCSAAIGKSLLESVLLFLERTTYKSSLPLSLPLCKSLGLETLLVCDISLYIPVDSTLLFFQQ